MNREWMGGIEEKLREITAHPFAESPVGAVLVDALQSRGKRLRPYLLLSCAAFGPNGKKAGERLYTLAAMVELTHLASLIHDDIVDEAAYRRGSLSVQRKYGKDAAVYAGDFIVARINYVQAKERLNAAGEILAQTIEQMCVGEIGQALCRYRTDMTREKYLENIRGKTAALFANACRIGAMEGGCDAALQERLTEFGQCFGVLFQLRDDLLDYTTARDAAGKDTHKDFRDGIYTEPLLLALECPGGKEALLPFLKKNAVSPLGDAEIGEMEQTVVSVGGVEAARKELLDFRNDLFALLDSLSAYPEAALLRELLSLLELP